MHSISVTPRATYRHWRGQGLNRLCLRWPTLPPMWRVAMKPGKDLISLLEQAGCR